jgi:hypothetical protein
VLNDSEIARLKFELGFNALTLGAEPYIGVTSFFTQVFLPNLQGGALTSSTSVVAAQPVGSGPAPVTLTLASPTGFNLLDRAIVDVDDAQEEATVQSVTGSTIVVRLVKAHGTDGAYPVTVEGGEAMIRYYLARCRKISQRIDAFGARAGIKKADEVEFFGGEQRLSGFRTLGDMQQHFRRELCVLVFGVGNIGSFGGAGGRIGVY